MLTAVSERGFLGTQEKNKFGIRSFPIREYDDTFRTFFEVNGTTSSGTAIEIPLNITEVAERTGLNLTATPINESTYRLYRVSRNGGLFNDTGSCFAQGVSVG